MKRIGLIFWPNTGNTAIVGEMIHKKFSNYPDLVKIDIIDFEEVTERKIKPFDCLVIGGSTIGSVNWHNANKTNRWGDFFKSVKMTDFSKKRVALFGLGDQVSYPYSFVDGMSELYDGIKQKGARMVGEWSTDGYDFADSKSIKGEYFIGLAIDQDNQKQLTNQRVDQWVDQLIGEFAK